MTLQRKQQGFTIVELLVVIVVIGILALITITTFSGVTQRSRDAKRQSDIKAIHGQLEAYYASNASRYPTLAQLNDTAFRGQYMKGLDADALKDPNGANNTVVATPAAKVYSYAVFASDGTTACDNTTTDCKVYKLTATLETGGTFEKVNLN